MSAYVIWITGLSGSGKTSVGQALVDHLSANGIVSVLLDGDELREIFPGGDRYDRESRLQLALAYGRLCRLLVTQGITVVCATISMRGEVFAWNRAHLTGYVEVLIDADDALRVQRDPKRHYERLQLGLTKDFAGHDQPVEWPPSPDIVLRPEAGETIAETTMHLVTRLKDKGLRLSERADGQSAYSSGESKYPVS